MFYSVLLQFLFQQMGMVVSFVKIHIRPYMDDIFTLIRVSSSVSFLHLPSPLCNPCFSSESGKQL